MSDFDADFSVTTFQKLLDDFAEVRDAEYRSDPERMEARMESISYTIQTMLENLRDLHDR